MDGYSAMTDPTYSALSSSDDDPRAMLRKIISPTSAAELVGPPPDAPPPHEAGRSTPLSGSLSYAPKEAVAKNLDTAAGRQSYNSPIGGLATGVSNPPDNGNVRSIVSPTQSVQPARPVQQAQPMQSAQQVRPQGLQQVQAARVQAYNNSAAPAQYAASQSPVSTDPLNPDPSASLRPGGTSSAIMPIRPQGAPTQVQGPSALDTAQSRLNTLTSTGSGVSQIKNGFARGAARVGDAALSAILPGVAPLVGGTTARNQMLIGRQQQVVGNLQGQQQATAQQADTASQTALRNQEAAKNAALAEADKTITLTPEEATQEGHPEWANTPLTQRTLGLLRSATIKGNAQENTGAGHDAAKVTTTGMNNATSTANTATRTSSNEGIAQARDKTQRLLGELRASVSTANNERTNQTHLTTSGLRAGGGAAGQPGSYKVPADVTKRAALAANVQENAGEVSKLLDGNPDIVGAVQGRFTNAEQMIGNDNPAISALGTRIHNIALAANGAHGVRSQEAVHATEREILNNFHNGPNAIKGALNATTSSVQTFLDDEKNFRQTGGRVAPPANSDSGRPASGKEVSLAAARGLAQNKGKTDAEITADIKAHGHGVKP